MLHATRIAVDLAKSVFEIVVSDEALTSLHRIRSAGSPNGPPRSVSCAASCASWGW
jgi:hypothetical protein